MIEILDEHDNMIGLRASGRLTHEDYQQVLVTKLDKMVNDHGPVRVLLFTG